MTQICHVTHRIGDVCTGQGKKNAHASSICERGCWYVRHDAQTCDVFVVRYSHVWRYSFIYVTLEWVYVTSLEWLMYMCTMTKPRVRYDWMLCVPWGHVCKGSFRLPCVCFGDEWLICILDANHAPFIDAFNMTHLYASQFKDIVFYILNNFFLHFLFKCTPMTLWYACHSCYSDGHSTLTAHCRVGGRKETSKKWAKAFLLLVSPKPRLFQMKTFSRYTVRIISAVDCIYRAVTWHFYSSLLQCW